MFNFAAQHAGMSQPSKKKPVKRGRKPSTKPGADHLSKLTQAHGSGDHQSAKLHALNYANAVTKHLKGSALADMDADDPTLSAPAQPMSGAIPSQPAAPAMPDRRAQLAKLAMSRRK